MIDLKNKESGVKMITSGEECALYHLQIYFLKSSNLNPI